MQGYSSLSRSFQRIAFRFEELTLCEMLDDPIVQDLMKSDRITPRDVLQALHLQTCDKLALVA
jgi:hypothetical protein